MKFSDQLTNTLPGGDWQRIETWAAIAGMTPAQYLSLCIRRGHEMNKKDLKQVAPDLKISPGLEGSK